MGIDSKDECKVQRNDVDNTVSVNDDNRKGIRNFLCRSVNRRGTRTGKGHETFKKSNEICNKLARPQ